MGTIKDKLQKAIESKADIKAALIEKGIAPDSVTDVMSQYGYLIRQIQSGGGGIVDAALKKANYDYISQTLVDMINESYAITKDWTDYSKVKGSQIFFLPFIEGADASRIEYRNCKRLLLQPSFINVDFSRDINKSKYFGCVRLLFGELRSDRQEQLWAPWEYFYGCQSLLRAVADGRLINRQCFRDCQNLEEIEIVASGEIHDVFYTFSGCYALERITGIELDFSKSEHAIDDYINNLRNLVEVRFKADSISKEIAGGNFRINDDNKLSHESLLSLLNALQQTTEVANLRLGATNLTKLSDAEKEIATKKGWTLN